MTLKDIQTEIERHRPASRETIYRWLKRYGLRPVGPRQRPANYPDNTARRILAALGFEAEVGQ
jgi:transposase